MRIYILCLLLFLTACSNEDSVNKEDSNIITESTNLSEKVYSSPPEMIIDLNKSYSVVIETDLGEITIDLFSDTAPITVNNFISLANDNYYDNVIFHRVISGFMIQGGDPSGTGHGDMGKYPGYKFDDELNDPQKYNRGIVAMANSGPNTNGSQFFIMHNNNELPYSYTIFGNVVDGLDVVDSIASSSTDPSDKPLTDIVIKNIRVIEN